MKKDISKLSIIARDLRPQPGTPSKPSSSISVALWLGCSELYTWPISSSRDSLTLPLPHETGKPSVTGSWSGHLHERPLSWLHSAQWDGLASPILSIIPIEMGTFWQTMKYFSAWSWIRLFDTGCDCSGDSTALCLAWLLHVLWVLRSLYTDSSILPSVHHRVCGHGLG